MYSPAVEPPAHPERQPGHRHARPLRSLSVEHPDGYIRQRRDIPAHLITSNYMALGLPRLSRARGAPDAVPQSGAASI
jgi:hypothetical protein